MYVKKLILFLIPFLIFISFFTIYIKFYNSPKIIPKIFNLNNVSLYQENEVFIQQDWTLSIPKLNLNNIPIKDSVEDNVLNNYIGHFPTSSYLKGNICLAAHNAGFSVNYFQDLPLLENGDEIEYNYYNVIKKYKVSKKYIINENDFDVLNLDNSDKLTLITCINNSPHQRLCIEAICEE